MAATSCLATRLTDMLLDIDCSQVAHPDIRDQLVSYIYNGFLVPVLAPALHKVSSSTISLHLGKRKYLPFCCFISQLQKAVILQDDAVCQQKHTSINTPKMTHISSPLPKKLIELIDITVTVIH